MEPWRRPRLKLFVGYEGQGGRRQWSVGSTDAPYTEGGRWGQKGRSLLASAIDFVDLGLTSMYQVPSHTTYPRDSNARGCSCSCRQIPFDRSNGRLKTWVQNRAKSSTTSFVGETVSDRHTAADRALLVDAWGALLVSTNGSPATLDSALRSMSTSAGNIGFSHHQAPRSSSKGLGHEEILLATVLVDAMNECRAYDQGFAPQLPSVAMSDTNRYHSAWGSASPDTCFHTAGVID